MNKKALFVLVQLLLSSCNKPSNQNSQFSLSAASSEFQSISETSVISSVSLEDSIIKCDHNIVIDKGFDATCTSTGLTDGSHCNKCGDVITPQEIIPMLDHSYELTDFVIDGNSNTSLRKAKYRCSVCHKMHTASLMPEDIKGMRIIEINGDMTGISKEEKKTVDINIIEEGNKLTTSKATIKLQGASSLGYPKKNYNITLIKDDGKKNKTKLVDEWGKQSKYTLKANWVDYSQSRNVVSGKLYGQIVEFRNLDDDLVKAPNGGAVDGYPVVIYLNNEYQGIYTLNIAKDNWMFAMDNDEVRQALLMGDLHNESIYLNEPVKNDFSNGWELEYCSTEDEEGTQWVVDSMNNFISWLNTADETEFLKNIKNKIHYERTIDSMLFSWFICAGDNFAKNILWATYDGIKWLPSVYDMDGTWGMMYHGESYYGHNAFLPSGIINQANCNLLWKKLYTYCKNDIKERYYELREDVLSQENIYNEFSKWFDSIPDIVKSKELEKWPSIPRPDLNTLSQIITYASNRIEAYDNFFKNW